MSELYTSKLTAIDPESVKKLDEYFRKSFKDVESYLNASVIETNMSEGKWLVPVVDSTPGTPTIPENGEEAFTLNPPGTITLTFEKVAPKTVVLRYAFDYETALFAAKSLKSFQSIFGPIVHDMIDELAEIKGFRSETVSYGGTYGRFTRPGDDDVIFRERESGDIELRLFSNSVTRPE
jgi:hypothetical protein